MQITIQKLFDGRVLVSQGRNLIEILPDELPAVAHFLTEADDENKGFAGGGPRHMAVAGERRERGG